MLLPNGIDPTKPVGELTDDELRLLAAGVLAHARWDGMPVAKKRRIARKMAKARMEKLTPEQRQAVARKGGLARAKKARLAEKEAHPPV